MKPLSLVLRVTVCACVVAKDRLWEKSRPHPCVRRPRPIVRLARLSSAPSYSGLMVGTMGLKNA